MKTTVNGYTPKLGDIVSINFDPSKGHEIQKTRPAIVVSNNSYNAVTGMIAVCPITSTNRTKEYFVPFTGLEKVVGSVNPFQVRTMDFTSSGRSVRFIQAAPGELIAKVLMRLEMVFGFNSLTD